MGRTTMGETRGGENKGRQAAQESSYKADGGNGSREGKRGHTTWGRGSRGRVGKQGRDARTFAVMGVTRESRDGPMTSPVRVLRHTRMRSSQEYSSRQGRFISAWARTSSSDGWSTISTTSRMC
jgi:hypothetical protein